MAKCMRSTLESLVGRFYLSSYPKTGSLKRRAEANDCCVGKSKAIPTVGLGGLLLLARVVYFWRSSSSSRRRSSSSSSGDEEW